jgi:hypothetical protein
MGFARVQRRQIVTSAALSSTKTATQNRKWSGHTEWEEAVGPAMGAMMDRVARTAPFLYAVAYMWAWRQHILVGCGADGAGGGGAGDNFALVQLVTLPKLADRYRTWRRRNASKPGGCHSQLVYLFRKQGRGCNTGHGKDNADASANL